MTRQYKVWLEIEEIDESRDHYQTVDTPGASVATFDSYKEASEFVEFANELLDPDSELSLGRQNRSGIATKATDPCTLTLLLLHGRRDPKQDMDGWGFSSKPIRGVKRIHITYFSTITIVFESAEATEAARKLTGWKQWDRCVLEVARYEDMIQASGCYFGDFELTCDER